MANKLCLNVQKTKLIFHPNNQKLDSLFKFKLQGKQLIPTESIKYIARSASRYLVLQYLEVT